MTTAPDPAAARTPSRTQSRRRRTPHDLLPPAGLPNRALAVLGAAAAALIAAFVLAPAPLAATAPHGGFASEHALSQAFSNAFVGYWNSHDRRFPDGMASIVDYWFRYHVAKAAFAAALLIVFVVLGVLLWKAARPVACAVMAMLALVSAVLMAANIQGAVAPFSSLLSTLPTGTSGASGTGADLGATSSQIIQQLTNYPKQTGDATPAVKVMVDDFGRYHAVIGIVGTIMTLVLLSLCAMSWRRFATTQRSDSRTKRAMLWFGILSALMSLALLVVTAANISTAQDPAPALLAFFQGGW